MSNYFWSAYRDEPVTHVLHTSQYRYECPRCNQAVTTSNDLALEDFLTEHELCMENSND